MHTLFAIAAGFTLVGVFYSVGWVCGEIYMRYKARKPDNHDLFQK